MNLQKKTDIGTLMAGYKPGLQDYAGFWVNLFRKGQPMFPICTVEYEPNKKHIQVVVYANGNHEEPTHIIPINLSKEEEQCNK